MVDVYQAGAGTSHNMNCNEVLANRANELLGSRARKLRPGAPERSRQHGAEHQRRHPDGDAPRDPRHAPAVARRHRPAGGRRSWRKGREFDHVIKSGRTHLQDATPIRLGQEFTAYGAHGGAPSAPSWPRPRDWLRDLNIGGTAVGTGLNAEPTVPGADGGSTWRTVSGLDLRVGEDRIQLMQSMGDIATFSGAVRAFVLDLNKIANDIRLLASGPRTGLAEIVLPAVQPGSSIMPGKVNPSIAEMVNQVCYQALGLDTTVAMAAEAGQLELNVMMPVITHNIVFGLMILGNAIARVRGAVHRRHRGRREAVRLLARAEPGAGDRAGAEDRLRRGGQARQGGGRDRPDRQGARVTERGILTGKELEDVLDLRAMTELGVPGGKGLPGGG